MTEGWHDDDYLVLFTGVEIETMTERYGLKRFIIGFQIVGLRGWDDFILRSESGKLSTIPTVPIDSQYLKDFDTVIDYGKIKLDARFSGKAKWYVQPIAFGGDPQAKGNMSWIDYQQHAEAVQWWNNKYLEINGA